MNEEGHAALAEAVYAKLKEMLAGEKENAQQEWKDNGC